MPSQVPCDGGLNREIVGRHPAWMAGWFSCPESPGFHPGLLGRATGPIPDSQDLQNNGRNRIPAAATPCRATPRNIKRREPSECGATRVKRRAFPQLTLRASRQPGVLLVDDSHAAAAGRAACTTPPPRGGHGRPEVRPHGRPAGGFTHRFGILPHVAGPAAAGSRKPALQAGRLHTPPARSGRRPRRVHHAAATRRPRSPGGATAWPSGGRLHAPLRHPASRCWAGHRRLLKARPPGGPPPHAASTQRPQAAPRAPRRRHGRPEVRPHGRPAGGFTHRFGILPHVAGPATAGS